MELVTVTALLGIVMGSILSVFMTMQRASIRQSARSEQGDLMRLSMERMTKEIRQATNVRAGSGASSLDIDTYVNGVETRVTYDATDGNRLTRTAEGTTLPMLERLTSNDIFTYTPDVTGPSTITILLKARPEHFESDETIIELTSEVQLRNEG